MAEEYLKAIAENAGLNLKEKDTWYFLDKKNKIGVLYLNKRWNKDIRVFHSDRKESGAFLYINEDKVRKAIYITLVIRDSEKSDAVDFVRIVNYNGYDVVLFNNQKREYNLFINDSLFFNDGNITIRDKNNNEIKVTVGEFDVEKTINDICNTILNMEHKTDKWDEEINGLLEFVKPAIRLVVTNFKENVNWLIESGLIVPTDEKTMKKS